MLLVMGCENALAELLVQPYYEGDRDYPPDTPDAIASRKREKSLAFEVEQFGLSLRYIETFFLEETAKSKRSQNFMPFGWQLRVTVDCRRVKWFPAPRRNSSHEHQIQ